MVKKIDILGIQLDNYSVHEAMQKVDVYLNNTVMNLVGTITTHTIEEAEKNETVREYIELLDLAIIGEAGLLKAAGINTTSRVKETEEHLFFFEFMKRMVRNDKKVCLLAEDEPALESFRTYLEEEFESIRIASGYGVDKEERSMDYLVNEINADDPDVILSVLPTPQQESFLKENRLKLSAKLWYGIGDADRIHKKAKGIRAIRSRLKSRRLKKKMVNYHNEKTYSDSENDNEKQ